MPIPISLARWIPSNKSIQVLWIAKIRIGTGIGVGKELSNPTPRSQARFGLLRRVSGGQVEG